MYYSRAYPYHRTHLHWPYYDYYHRYNKNHRYYDWWYDYDYGHRPYDYRPYDGL